MTGLLLDFGDLEIRLVEDETPLRADVEFDVEFAAQRSDGSPTPAECLPRRGPPQASGCRRAAERPSEFDAIYQRDVAPFRRGDGVHGHVGRAGAHVVAVCTSPWRAP
jgi:hypothetical protein